MTQSEWVRDLIEEEWDTSEDPIPGEGVIREPIGNQPKFRVEGSAERRADQVDTQPILYINDGGNPTRDPKSIGYRAEQVEAEITVEVVTSGSRIDFRGHVDNSYGGVTGEFKRIMDKHRNGLVESEVSVRNPEYDVLLYDRFDDDSDRRGGGIWTGSWTVRFITFAQKIIYN